MDTAQNDLQLQINQADIPFEIKEKLLDSLQNNAPPTYIDFCLSLPFNKSGQDILDLARAKEILDKNHFGLQSVKDRVLEYLAVLILNSKKGDQVRAPILLFVGLVGTGKTSLAYSIAESLGRPIIRIPFGGLGEAGLLKGLPKSLPSAEPGQIMKALKSSGVKNPVILLDEIDRVDEGRRVDIMGILVELLDPAQNHAFVDHFLDFPFDLSQVLFIATANNTGNIATAVMDRLEPIQMPAYSDNEKITIGKNYLLPKAIKEAGLEETQVIIDESIWPQIIRPLGFDGGIRSLNRLVQDLSRKIARQVVEGQSGPFKITSENIGGYINL